MENIIDKANMAMLYLSGLLDKKALPICVDCKCEFMEYDAPRDLCGRCWALWMSHYQEGDVEILSPETEKALYEEMMEIVNLQRQTRLSPKEKLDKLYSVVERWEEVVEKGAGGLYKEITNE